MNAIETLRAAAAVPVGRVTLTFGHTAVAAVLDAVARQYGEGEGVPVDIERVLAIKGRHRDALMALDGVVGVGVSGGPLTFHIAAYLERAGVELPEALDGVPVVGVVTGPITANALPAMPSDKPQP